MRTANEIFIPPRRQFNCFFSVRPPFLLMLTCQGGKGGKRPHICSIISAEKLFSFFKRWPQFPSFAEIYSSFTSQSCTSVWELMTNCMQLFPSCRCSKQQQQQRKHTPDRGEFVCRAMSTFLCTLVYVRTPLLPICHCAIMIRGKEVPAPQLPCRLPTRTCQLRLDQHPCDWKITTRIYKHRHRCGCALV